MSSSYCVVFFCFLLWISKSEYPLCLRGTVFPGASEALSGFHLLENEGAEVIFNTTKGHNTVYSEEKECGYYLPVSIEEWTIETSCTISSTAFSQAGDTFQSFSEKDSFQLDASYGTKDDTDPSVTGSLSVSRHNFRSQAAKSQYDYYIIDMKCYHREFVISTYSKLLFTEKFAEDVVALPQSYNDGEDYTDFLDFWTSYGTHYMDSGQLGGIVYGSVSADTCMLQEEFGSENEFTTELDAAYKGFEGDTAIEQSEYEKRSAVVESVLEQTEFIIKGGESNTFLEVFASLDGEKTNKERIAALTTWQNSIWEKPVVVSGVAKQIGKLLEKVGKQHTNYFVHRGILTNDELVNIGEAMQKAYQAYAEHVRSENELVCDFMCNNDGTQDSSTCECSCEPDDKITAKCCGSGFGILTMYKSCKLRFIVSLIIFFYFLL